VQIERSALFFFVYTQQENSADWFTGSSYIAVVHQKWHKRLKNLDIAKLWDWFCYTSNCQHFVYTFDRFLPTVFS